MGTYMRVVLKEHVRFDSFIKEINKVLADRYGAATEQHFNSWEELQREADYLNHDPEGRKELSDWNRPITKEQLHGSFFWPRLGEYSFKLSGSPSIGEAKDAIAVCKWIIRTKGHFIDKKLSGNYSKRIVGNYLNSLFLENGESLKMIWAMPK